MPRKILRHRLISLSVECIGYKYKYIYVEIQIHKYLCIQIQIQALELGVCLVNFFVTDYFPFLWNALDTMKLSHFLTFFELGFTICMNHIGNALTTNIKCFFSSFYFSNVLILTKEFALLPVFYLLVVLCFYMVLFWFSLYLSFKTAKSYQS